MCRCLQQALCIPVRVLGMLQVLERRSRTLASTLSQIELEQPSSFRQSKEKCRSNQLSCVVLEIFINYYYTTIYNCRVESMNFSSLLYAVCFAQVIP